MAKTKIVKTVWAIFSISFSSWLVWHGFFIIIGNVIEDDSQASNQFTFRVQEPPLSDYELSNLFPEFIEDWKFAQEIAGISNVRMPEVFYQEDLTQEQLFSFGIFYKESYTIMLDRSNFTERPTAFARYVLIHEMIHAALDRSTLRDEIGEYHNEHCYMVDMGIFDTIGYRIGNAPLGGLERERHNLMYGCEL